MKILIMDTVKPQLNRASAVHRWELIRNLAEIGHDVWVIAYKNIEFKRVHTNLLQAEKGVLGKLSARFKYMRMLFKLATRHHFDILYTRNGLAGVIGYLLKVMTGSNLVYELNGITSDEWESVKKQNKNGILKEIEMALSIRAEMFALRKADAIIVVTEGIKNWLVGNGIEENEIWVIKNGVNIELFRPIKDSPVLNELKNKLSISNDENVVTYAGSLNAPWQGVEHLIHTVPLIIKEFPKTKFLIVGDGIMREKLESLTKKLNMEHNIFFIGRVQYENVSKYINISDVCVAPFIRKRNERIGLSSLKISEYLACGKPIVAGNIKNIGELLKNSNSGIAVTPDNPNELADAVIRLLKDKQLREQMGKNGRELVVNNYSWENTAMKTVEVFEEVLSD